MEYANELLQQVAAELNKRASLWRSRISDVMVILVVDDKFQYEFSLPQFLDAVANNLYWDERGNWRQAWLAKVDLN